MSKHIANTLLMVEPVAFGFNAETAVNNYFQQNDSTDTKTIQEQALAEFKSLEKVLQEKGINLYVVKDSEEPHTPDSIFPNNWISFHRDGRLGIYPMYAQNRRLERRPEILHQMVKDGFVILDIADYTESEKENEFLEGTGSMVLDRKNKIAYAALSERTDKELFLRFCNDFHYKPIHFKAFQSVAGKREPIYHTNVLMCVASDFAIICLDAIDNTKHKQHLIDSLTSSGKEIIEISEYQMHHFAGNMLQIANSEGKIFLVMSQAAYDSLNPVQIERIESHNPIIKAAIPTIEKYGGGSVRCMLAEVFVPRNA